MTSTKLFELPPIFKKFEVTKDFTIMEDLVLTLRLPGSMDTAWATSSASGESTPETMNFHYIPKIIAAMLHKVNGQLIMHMINGSKQAELKLALNPNTRKKLKEEAHTEICQWVYENIISRIPFEVLQPIYDKDIVEWIDSADGLVDTPATIEKQLEEEAKKLDRNAEETETETETKTL